MNDPVAINPANAETAPYWPEDKTRPLELGDVIGILRKRWLYTFACTVAGGAIALYLVTSITPKYTAYGQMLLGEQNLSARSDFDLLEAQAVSNTVIQGELAILRSSELLVRVIGELGLETDPEFNPELRPDEDRIPVISWVEDQLRALIPDNAPPPSADSLSEATQNASTARDRVLGDLGPVVGDLRGAVSVRQQGSSFVVQVSATSESPQKAAAIVNTVTDQYINFLTDKRFEAAQRFTRWLEGRVEDLATKLEASEMEALAYRTRIEAGADSSVRIEQQMRELTSKLTDARATLAESTARATKLADLTETEGALAAADVLTSDVISAYRDDLAALRRDEATANISFGEDAIQVQSIRRAMERIEEAVAIEVQREVQQLVNSAEIMSDVVFALESSLRDLEATVLVRSNEQIKLNQLERIAEANRRVYEEFLGRFKETSEIQNLQSTDAEVISYASPPGAAAYPRKQVVAVLGTAAGFFVGLALAFLLHLMPKRIATASDVTSLTGLSLFGRAPRLPRGSGWVNALWRQLKRPSSSIGKAAVALWNNVDLNIEGDVRTVVVTSDGTAAKSQVALMIAWAAMKKGRSCLVVDADLRHASLTKALGLKAEDDLLSVLYGDTPLLDAIKITEDVDFVVLPASVISADPSMVFSTARAQTMIDQMKEHFDVIVFDAPSMETDVDAIMTPELLHSALLVVDAKRTRAGPLRNARRVFERLKARKRGAVLTGVSA
ncbi:GumC family protein [Aestuariibius insulae]|uniref:GumC family protein n=1 Tax=Aestuariibius insulae TaxID=2058287 RepID=UPI00345EA7AB